MNSLAAEILVTPKLSLKSSSKSILANLADIQDSLSDFNSCIESSAGSSSDEAEKVEENVEIRTANEKKRSKKKKRKLNLTPGKEQFLKKQNTQTSPVQ